jgi:hypothetical protein
LRLRRFARHLAEAAFSTPWTHGASTHLHLEGGVTTWAHFPRESLLAFSGAPRTAVPRREGLRRTRRGLVALYQQLRGTTVQTHCAHSQGAAAPFRTLSQASLQSRCMVHPIRRPCMTNSGHEPLLYVHGQKPAASFRTKRPDECEPGIQGESSVSTCSDRPGCTAVTRPQFTANSVQCPASILNETAL